MFGKKYNPFFARMEDEVDNVIKGKYFRSPCNLELIPMIQELYIKIITTEIDWNGSFPCWHLENLLKIANYVAKNTRNYERLSSEDSDSIQKSLESWIHSMMKHLQ